MNLSPFIELIAENRTLYVKLIKVLQQPVSSKSVSQLLKQSQYSNWLINDQQLEQTCKTLNSLKNPEQLAAQEQLTIGEALDAKLKIEVSQDKMQATAEIESAYGGEPITAKKFKAQLDKLKIVFGINSEHAKQLMTAAHKGSPGSIHSAVIAHGIEPIHGIDSKFEKLVPSLMERILKPQAEESIHKVDMRNLGPLVCVKENQPLMKRIPPTKGTSGKNILGETLLANEGVLISFEVKEGTAISESDENLLIATRVGIPKYSESGAEVDPTLTVNEVSITTGHLSYTGGIVCNGDVSEKMRVKAAGDVTISGTVESAIIEAKGDVVIMQGALGKRFDDEDDHSSEFSCNIIATGNVYIAHAQGVYINAGGKVVIDKQLAFSKVRATKSIIVGKEDNPAGKVFASDLYTAEQVKAGTLGATSGSTLNISFSDLQSKLQIKQEKIQQQIKEQIKVLIKLQKKLSNLQNQINQGDSVDLEDLKVTYQKFKKLRKFIRVLKAQSSRIASQQTDSDVEHMAIANKSLFANVFINGHRRQWRNGTDYGPSKIIWQEHGNWGRDPL